ncbi:MAG: hypothetical protein R3Y35_15260 [Clostridia bacterium]
MGRLNLTVTDEMLDRIDFQKENAKAKDRGDFTRKALEFYLSFLETSRNQEYLNQSVALGVRQGINDIEKQTMPNIFRLSVEMSMMWNILSATLDLDQREMRKLRSDCVNAVRATEKRCSPESAMKFQNDYPTNDKFYDEFQTKVEIDLD